MKFYGIVANLKFIYAVLPKPALTTGFQPTAHDLHLLNVIPRMQFVSQLCSSRYRGFAKWSLIHPD